MSRLADLLNHSTDDMMEPVVAQNQKSDDKSQQSPHHRLMSINSPLEALAIDEQMDTAENERKLLLTMNKRDIEQQQADDKEIHTTVNSIDTPMDQSSSTITNCEALIPKTFTSSENQLPLLHNDVLKTELSTGDHPSQTIQQVKKEESQGPASLLEIPSPAPIANMPPRGPPKKKSVPGNSKRPAAKKRKLDSRADTPQSQRSGTPNSVLGVKSGSRAKKQNSPTPFHSSPGVEDDEGDDDESDDGLYCICRKGDDHTWMIGCDGGCDDWFHGRCVGIDQRDGNLIDKFICPNCSESKGAETTWKPMCRLDGCREPAAINAPRPSKYCCDDHAAQFFRRFIKKGLGVETLSSAKKRRKENLTDNYQSHREDYDQPTHLRGGLLSPAELKAITSGLQTCKEFRSLGESVPVVQDAKSDPDAMDTDASRSKYTDHESEQLGKTNSRTEKLRNQLTSLEDRERFLALVKGRAKAASEELKKKDKSMKDMCGFDRRLRWSDEDFDSWRNSDEGKEAFTTNKLKPDQIDADGDANMADTDELGKGMCMRKRCKQHEGWYKLHSQEFAYGKADVSREVSRLAAEKESIEERATIRHLEAIAEPTRTETSS